MIRFWSKVNKTETCWLWTGARTSAGYGNFRVGGRNVGAHRFAYEQLIGLIPDGLTIDHLCRIRHCVNPAHMEPVTSLVNTLRGIPSNRRKTTCPRGHAYSRTGTNRARRCAVCEAERANLAYHALTPEQKAIRNAKYRRRAPARAPRTHCKHGHLLDDDNAYVYRGHRYCRACNRISHMEAARR